MRMQHFASTLLAVAAFGFLSDRAYAEKFGGVEFPQGAISFADVLVSFEPVIKSGQPGSAYLDGAQALGIPDSGEVPIGYVSLGDGGSITLKFVDNYLTGSDSSSSDLWVFEIGPDVEDTFVEISKDGTTYTAVGKVTGGTRSVDIDAFGYGSSDWFSYVRLTDDTNEGDQTGVTVGADIDALGAISTVVPEPSIASLVLAGICLAHRRR